MIILILLFHLYLLINTGFTAWPEMFSFPYLFDRGFMLYKDIAHVYQPLLTLTLFIAFKLFGYKLIVLKIFTWAVIIINDLLIYKILKGRKIALASVFIYILMQVFFEGNMLWFDLATTPLILLLLYASLNTNYLLMGLFLALSIFIKQQTALLIIPVIFVLIKNKGSWIKVILGGLIPTIPILVWILLFGAFKDYIFWSVTFPLHWLPTFKSYPVFPTSSQWLIIFLISVPMIIGLFKKLNFIFVLFFLALLTAAFPRFSYFHLQPVLVIYPIVVGHLLKYKNLRLFVLFLSIGTAALLIKPQTYTNRFYEKTDIQLAQKISKLVKPEEKVFLLGPHSLLYVLADRIPPKPWIDNYVWHFEIPNMQKMQIAAWEKDPPIYILRTPPNLGAWDALGVYQPQEIINYMTTHYDKISLLSDNIEVWRRK